VIVQFFVSSETSYTVTPGAEEAEKRDEEWGMLTRILLMEDDGETVVSDWSSYDGTQYADDREQYEVIAAAATVANIMLPDPLPDEECPVLMYADRV